MSFLIVNDISFGTNVCTYGAYSIFDFVLCMTINFVGLLEIDVRIIECLTTH